MIDNKTVSLTISLPKDYRDLVRKKAAEWNLDHPDEIITGARIARDIVIEYLDGWLKDHGKSSDELLRKEKIQ